MMYHYYLYTFKHGLVLDYLIKYEIAQYLHPRMLHLHNNVRVKQGIE